MLDELGATFDGRLRVTAVDRTSGKRVVFGAPGAPAATVTQAVLASCAVPWVFAPQRIDGRDYVDGGAWSAANLDAAPVRRGSHVLCLLPTGSARVGRDPLGAYRLASRAGTGARRCCCAAAARACRSSRPTPRPSPRSGTDLFDPRRRGDVERAGHAQGRALASTA